MSTSREGSWVDQSVDHNSFLWQYLAGPVYPGPSTLTTAPSHCCGHCHEFGLFCPTFLSLYIRFIAARPHPRKICFGSLTMLMKVAFILPLALCRHISYFGAVPW
jgi:hypothetical protein